MTLLTHSVSFNMQIDDSNFIEFAKEHYKNNQCVSVDEFYEDLNRIRYIKKLFRKYLQTGGIQPRLIINHFIILYNVFNKEALNKILFFKMQDEYHPLLKTMLVYMDKLDQDEIMINKIDVVSIPLDDNLISILRRLDKET